MSEPQQAPTERALTAALERLYREGYQPMYNGRPSCPFCGNFVDDEETHTAGCVLRFLDAERAARAEPGRGALEYAPLWAEFEAWESKAAKQGSGMTRDQMTGASMMLGWLTLQRRAALEAQGEPQEGER